MCERYAAGGKTHPICSGKYTLDGLFSLFEYRGIIARAVTQVKFRRLTDVRMELARLVNYTFRKFYEEDLLAELEDFIFYANPFVIPIPLHWWRKMERKFNQAEFIANILTTEYQRPLLTDLLIRAKNTQQQTKLRGKEREDNVKGVFRVRKKYLTEPAGKKQGEVKLKLDKNLRSILLVDDVTTTGATLKSAANTLKRAGAEKIWALTLAA